ncbi:hypothetical protein RBR11_17860 [Microbacterium sp. ASV81]|uniref:Uncharacterized protein n=2 Tax=Microbacterium capsulatum TaxID=3041921 RepID=A0ABU0XKV9_9MICO|nr:hypothetical protein [Microbacterium sp. ASV81]
MGIAKLFLGSVLAAGSALYAVAIILRSASGPAVISSVLAGLLFLAALLQGWGLFPVAMNARGHARRTAASDWVIVRQVRCAVGDETLWATGPGWILWHGATARIEEPRSQFAFHSRARTVLEIGHDSVLAADIRKPFRGRYAHVFLTMHDGRLLEIDVAPRSGSTGWGVRRGRLLEVADKLRGTSSGHS